MEVTGHYVLSEISSPLLFSVSANKKFTCLTEDSKLVFINSLSHDSWSIMDVGDNIKGIRLQNQGNLISVATSLKVLLIIDLQTKSILHRFENFFSIEHFKWHPENESCFFMVRNENSLERWQGSNWEFTLSSTNIPSLMYFELIPHNPAELIILTLDGELKIVNLKDKTEKIIDKVSVIDSGPLLSLDSDVFCIQTPQYLKFYSIQHCFSPYIINKTIFRYEQSTQFLLFSDFMSKSATILSKSTFISNGLSGETFEIPLIDNPIEIEFVPKEDDSNPFDILTRHNNKVYTYTLNFSVKPKPTPEKPLSDLYIFTKDAVNQVVDSLNKRFEEQLKKLDKSLSMLGTLQNVNRSVVYALDKKSEEANINLTSATYTSLIQSFRAEVLTTLVAQLESDIKEVLQKFSLFYQDHLKLKVERNGREEEKSKKLASHLKNTITCFMGFEEKIMKTLKKKAAALTEFDLKTVESSAAGEIVEFEGESLKSEIDSLLHQKKFEAAILRALEEKRLDIILSVLSVLNPKPLIGTNNLSSKASVTLLNFLLQNISSAQTYPDLYIWLEELVKVASCSDLRSVLPKILDASFTFPQLNSIAKTCTRKIEETYKYET